MREDTFSDAVEEHEFQRVDGNGRDRVHGMRAQVDLQRTKGGI